jgi:hypothetical protein
MATPNQQVRAADDVQLIVLFTIHLGDLRRNS